MGQDQQEPDDLPPASSVEIGLALATPATFANKIVAFGGPVGLRLAFIEAGPDGATLSPRASVILSWEDAKILGRLVSKAISHIEGTDTDDK